jgi:hypothetical protein
MPAQQRSRTKAHHPLSASVCTLHDTYVPGVELYYISRSAAGGQTCVDRGLDPVDERRRAETARSSLADVGVRVDVDARDADES